MSIDSLRKHLVTKQPPHIESAKVLALRYGISTSQVTHTLKLLNYSRSTDNTGWYLQTISPVEEPLIVAISYTKQRSMAEKAEALSEEVLKEKLIDSLNHKEAANVLRSLAVLMSRWESASVSLR